MPWVKGQSGNPRGQPKKRLELKARCAKVVDELIVDAWIAEIRDHEKDWVECSKLLAAYGYGKPAQRIEVAQEPEQEIDLHRLTSDELRTMDRLLDKATPTESRDEQEEAESGAVTPTSV